jgi:hypothetical protein
MSIPLSKTDFRQAEKPGRSLEKFQTFKGKGFC